MNIVYRPRLDLTGFWRFKVDPDKQGMAEQWFNGLPDQALALSAYASTPLGFA